MNRYIEQKMKEAPIFITEKKELLQAYHMAIKNLMEINSVPCPAEIYNKSGMLDEKYGLMIRAGGGYPTPWTRDASVNTMNAACFLEPEVAKNTLWAVCEQAEGKLCFQLDNQSWDKIIWATGAWKYYLATGDSDFLTHAYETVKNSIEMLEESHFNSEYGLFMGGSFFNDGITGYPKELHEEGNESSFVGDHPATAHIMSCSTNCLYYNGYAILGRMAAILSEEEKKIIYEKKAAALKKAINRWLWNEEKGAYAYFLYPDGSADWSQEGCGIAFSVLFDVCTKEQAVRMLGNCYRSRNGFVSIWPPFRGISSVEAPVRHNNLIWPVVNGFLIPAAAKCGFAEMVGAELESIASLAINNDGFWEIYNAETGKPDGGWQSGRHWDSVQDQTWSATGFLSGIVFGLFGITLEEEKITFHPCLPKGFGPIEMDGLHFRDVILDISLQGSGNRISSLSINGTGQNEIPFGESGHYKVDITLQ